MVRLDRRCSGVLAALLLVVNIGSVRAQDATPSAADPAAPPTVLELVASTLPAELRPTGEVSLLWSRVEWESGVRRVFPAGDGPEGINLSYVLAGTIEMHVAGEVRVGRATPGQPTGALEPVATGEPVTLNQGDLVVFPNQAERHTRNIGPDRARIIAIQIVAAESDVALPPIDEEVTEQSLGTIAAPEWAAVPPGELTVSLRRTLLPPGGELPMYRVTAGAPELLNVEAGLMEIGFDYDSDGTSDQWIAVDGFVPLNEMLAGVSERFIRASTSPSLFDTIEDPEDPSPDPEPLVFMTLTLTPTNLPPPPPSTATPEAAEPPGVTGEGADCAGADVWAGALRDQARALAAEHGAVLETDPAALESVPVESLQQAASDFRAAADDLEASTPPPVVTFNNQNLVNLLRSLADAADELALAVESGDVESIGAAAAPLAGLVGVYRGEIAATASLLTEVCPDLSLG